MHDLDGLYAGRPIYVLSTGTSLRQFDFSRLDGTITAGVNRIIEHYHPTVMHFIDVTAHKTHDVALRDYDGLIVAGQGAAPPWHKNAVEVHHNEETFELQPGGTELSTYVGRSFSEGLFGGGSGCTALHMAILLGGNPIYLLGYDFYEDNGRHFDAFDASRNDKSIYPVHRESIEAIARQPWIPEIYNCNPRSRLTCFPYADVDALLPRERRRWTSFA